MRFYIECVFTKKPIFSFGSKEDCKGTIIQGCHTDIGPVHRDSVEKYNDIILAARLRLDAILKDLDGGAWDTGTGGYKTTTYHSGNRHIIARKMVKEHLRTSVPLENIAANYKNRL